MKTLKEIGASRNSRLNRARALTGVLQAMLSDVEGTQKTVPLMDGEFWEACRDAVAEMNQCIHEANAYNNSMVAAGITFDRDTFTISEPRSQEVKASGFDPDIPGSTPDAAAAR